MKKCILFLMLLSACGSEPSINNEYEVFVEENETIEDITPSPTPSVTNTPSVTPSPTNPPIVCKKIIYNKKQVICVKKGKE